MFAFVALATPGPNNMMVLASGVHFGFRHSFPHLASIALGLGLKILLVSLGFGQMSERLPWLDAALTFEAAGIAQFTFSHDRSRIGDPNACRCCRDPFKKCKDRGEKQMSTDLDAVVGARLPVTARPRTAPSIYQHHSGASLPDDHNHSWCFLRLNQARRYPDVVALR